MAEHDTRGSTAPQVRGKGAWWYGAILGILLLAGIIAAIWFA